ncbi:MAG: sigma factor-like helix-turn-helix DNA-binding protein [Bacillota bacterium]|nr:sigma factor-like helix-turn-helix DNA-binding protein [Bacillota bacterium]
MNYIDEARWMLTHYDQLRAAVVNMEQEAAALYEQLCPAGTYSQMLVRAGPPSTVPRDLTETMLEVTNHPELVRLREEIKRTRADLERLDRAVDSLDEKHRRVVVLRYRERFMWKEVAAALNISQRTAYYWAREAVKEVAIALWGRQGVAATVTRGWTAPEGCTNVAVSTPEKDAKMVS